MGALVTKDIEDNSVILGPKATILDSEDLLAKIKKIYFNL